MTVTNLTTAYAALGLGLTRAERGEVIVEQEAHVALVEHIIYHLLIKFRTEGNSRERLCLTTGEDTASMRHGQRRYLAPDGADLIGLTTIQTLAFIEDATAHGVALHVVIILINQGLVVLLADLAVFSNLVLSEIFLLEVLYDLLESLGAGLLLESLTHYVVGGLIALLANQFAQGLIVNFMAIFALHVLAQFLREGNLHLAHRLDGLHGTLQRTEQILLRDFLHLAFHHHDVLSRSTYHEVHIGFLHLLEGGVDDILTVDAGYANLRNGALEGDIRNCQGAGSGETGKGIGLINAIGREKHHIHKHLCMEICREERAEHTVHQT